MKKFLIPFCLLFAGCAAPGPTIYNPTNLDENALAIVRPAEIDMVVDAGYRAEISKILNQDHVEITNKGGFGFGYPEARLKPGKYTLAVFCSNGQRHARPEIEVELAASKNYEISCSPIFGKQNKYYISEMKLIMKEIK